MLTLYCISTYPIKKLGTLHLSGLPNFIQFHYSSLKIIFILACGPFSLPIRLHNILFGLYLRWITLKVSVRLCCDAAAMEYGDQVGGGGPVGSPRKRCSCFPVTVANDQHFAASPTEHHPLVSAAVL